jgi:hypothetical protein
MPSQKRARDEDNSENLPPPKIHVAQMELPDKRTAYKAELVILDKFSPPQYPISYEGDTKSEEKKVRREQMINGCSNAVHWLESAGTLSFYRHFFTLIEPFRYRSSQERQTRRAGYATITCLVVIQYTLFYH